MTTTDDSKISLFSSGEREHSIICDALNEKGIRPTRLVCFTLLYIAVKNLLEDKVPIDRILSAVSVVKFGEGN